MKHDGKGKKKRRIPIESDRDKNNDDETVDVPIEHEKNDDTESSDEYKAPEISELKSEETDESNVEMSDEERIEHLQSSVEQLQNELLRERASFQNYRKRAEEEKAQIRQYGAQDLAFDLLCILDYLEESMKFEVTDSETQACMLGVKFTIEELHRILAKHGIKEIDTSGEFDPRYHEAFGADATADETPGTILQVHRKGYVYKDRVLRNAMVTVAVEPDHTTEERSDSDKCEN